MIFFRSGKAPYHVNHIPMAAIPTETGNNSGISVQSHISASSTATATNSKITGGNIHHRVCCCPYNNNSYSFTHCAGMKGAIIIMVLNRGNSIQFFHLNNNIITRTCSFQSKSFNCTCILCNIKATIRTKH